MSGEKIPIIVLTDSFNVQGVDYNLQQINVTIYEKDRLVIDSRTTITPVPSQNVLERILYISKSKREAGFAQLKQKLLELEDNHARGTS